MGYKNDIDTVLQYPRLNLFVLLTQEIKSPMLNSGLATNEAAYYRASDHEVWLRVFTSPRWAVTNNH